MKVLALVTAAFFLSQCGSESVSETSQADRAERVKKHVDLSGKISKDLIVGALVNEKATKKTGFAIKSGPCKQKNTQRDSSFFNRYIPRTIQTKVKAVVKDGKFIIASDLTKKKKEDLECGFKVESIKLHVMYKNNKNFRIIRGKIVETGETKAINCTLTTSRDGKQNVSCKPKKASFKLNQTLDILLK